MRRLGISSLLSSIVQGGGSQRGGRQRLGPPLLQAQVSEGGLLHAGLYGVALRVWTWADFQGASVASVAFGVSGLRGFLASVASLP